MSTAVLVTKVVVVGLILGFLFLALGLLVKKAADKQFMERAAQRDKMLKYKTKLREVRQ